MTEADFWSLVERCGGSATEEDCYEAATVLERELHALPPPDIGAFKHLFQEQMNRAYTWNLWGAAFVMNGGCSDDGFEYFRAWLIMQGRQVFEAALSDAESLADVVTHGDVECEAVLYSPFKVYEEVTGTSLPPGPSQPPEPAGAPWTEDDLDARFPRLTATLG